MRFFYDLPEPLKGAFKNLRPFFTSAILFSALINVLYLSPTIYMMQVYDRVVPTGGIFTLICLTFVIAMAIGTLTALENTRSRIMMRAALRLDEDIADPILDRLVARQINEGTDDPRTAQMMREFDALRRTMSSQPMMALLDVPWMPIYLIAAFAIHPVLGMLVVGAGTLLIVLAVISERVARARAQEERKANMSAYASHEVLAAKSEVIRALGMRRSLVARQQEARSEGLVAGTITQFTTSRYSTIVKFVRMLMQSVALGVGAWLAINGQISVGTIIAASVLLSRALQPVEQLVGSWGAIGQAIGTIKSLKALFEETEGQTKQPMLLPPPQGKVEFSNVTLRNADSTAFILRGISFEMNPGEVLGLVGHSGAGKSTIARIASGAIRPHAGEVRIDGALLSDWDPERLAQFIGYLPQDCALLPGTICENISRFAPVDQRSVDEVALKVIEAAKIAGIHDLILRLPEGYSTRIGATNPGLSGGQCQRIALARALYNNPPILLLDEPSSALDAEGEQALIRAINAARLRGATVMMAAHRSFILNNADRLVVIANGAIEHVGPRQEVIDQLREQAAQQNVVQMSRG